MVGFSAVTPDVPPEPLGHPCGPPLGPQRGTKACQRPRDLPLLRQGSGADLLVGAGAGAADHGGNDAEFVVTGTWAWNGWHHL